MTLQELTVVINAQTSGLKKELGTVNKQLTSLDKTTKNSTKSIGNSFSKLSKYISAAAIVTALTKIGKSALEAASDLAEVQNVVDVAFGSAAEEINQFAKTAITQFGISEYQAKKCSSTFMAMANGMGIAAESGKLMSVQLTGLAADMASFYNVSQDVAETALKSVFTGETETLKKFGVVMTEANLEAYALSKGITKSYKEMSQAEKVALRYNFVLQSTQNAQNDYSRTSDSWANQLRLLSNQWTSLLTVLGNGLTKVLLPVLQTLTNILGTLVTLTQNMFGISENSTAVSNDVSDISDSFEEADENAKNLKKTVSGFDELNVIGSSEDTSSGEITGGVNLDLNSYFNSNAYVESANNELVEKIKAKWNGLVQWFNSLPKLDIEFNTDSILNNARNTIQNLFDMFGNTGHLLLTIGVEFLNDIDIGKLSEQVSNLLNKITELGKTISSILGPIIENFYKNYISPMVEWLGEKLSGAIQFVSELFEDWSKWFEDNKQGIDDFFYIIGTAVQVLWAVVKPILDEFLFAVKNIIKIVSGLVQNFLTFFFEQFSNIKQILNGIIDFIAGVFTGDWKRAWNGIKNWFEAIWKGLVSSFKLIINSVIDVFNGCIRGINYIKIPNWSIFGSLAGKGLNIPEIPKLANGGVITNPTIAMLGEYSGASNNPEIAAPESKLREIFAEGNNDLIDVWISTTKQIITAINNKDMNVSINDDAIGRSVVRANNTNKMRTGMALI